MTGVRAAVFHEAISVKTVYELQCTKAMIRREMNDGGRPFHFFFFSPPVQVVFDSVISLMIINCGPLGSAPG